MAGRRTIPAVVFGRVWGILLWEQGGFSFNSQVLL
jgi:hypothetical protein